MDSDVAKRTDGFLETIADLRKQLAEKDAKIKALTEQMLTAQKLTDQGQLDLIDADDCLSGLNMYRCICCLKYVRGDDLCSGCCGQDIMKCRDCCCDSCEFGEVDEEGSIIIT